MLGGIDMRELKFRAWDKYHKVFRSNVDVVLFIKYSTEDPFLKMNHVDNYNNKDRDFNNDRIVIQQYTGIKDIDNKEIYEGDILDKKLKLIIEFFNGSFGYWYLENFISICNVTDIICRLKVIGNIYENPELFENHI
jgi:hypothetical protein